MPEDVSPVLRFRQFPRVPFDAPVELGKQDIEERIRARIEDLSPQGMLVRGQRPGRPGERLAFRFDADQGQVRGIGELIWVRSPTIPGENDCAIGVRFRSLTAGAQDCITDIVAKHLVRRGRARSQRRDETTTPAPASAAPPASDGSLADQELRGTPLSASVEPEVGERPPLRQRAGQFRWRLWAPLFAALLALGVLLFVVTRREGKAVDEPAIAAADPASTVEEPGSVPRGAIGQPPSDDPNPMTARLDESAAAAEQPRIAGDPGTAASPEKAATTAPLEPPSDDEATSASPVPAEAPPTDAPRARPVSVARRVLRIEPESLVEETIVRITGDGYFESQSMSALLLDDPPPRYLLRINGIEEPFVPRQAVDSEHLARIRTALHATSGGAQLHIVLDLTSRDIDIVTQTEDREIVLRLSDGKN